MTSLRTYLLQAAAKPQRIGGEVGVGSAGAASAAWASMMRLPARRQNTTDFAMSLAAFEDESPRGRGKAFESDGHARFAQRSYITIEPATATFIEKSRTAGIWTSWWQMLNASCGSPLSSAPSM